MTPHEINRLRDLYRTHTSRELAKIYGKSDDAMRALLSYYAIEDQKPRLRYRDVLKYWMRGTIDEIAELLDVASASVRCACEKLGLLERSGQMCLFPFQRRSAKKLPSMRVVHRAKPCVQLALEFEQYQMAA